MVKLSFEQEKRVKQATKGIRAMGSGRDGDERQINVDNHWFGFRMTDAKWQIFEVYTWKAKELIK